MTPVQKRDRILLQIETATSRYRLAQAAATAKGSTPALKRFTQDSLKEWHTPENQTRKGEQTGEAG